MNYIYNLKDKECYFKHSNVLIINWKRGVSSWKDHPFLKKEHISMTMMHNVCAIPSQLCLGQCWLGLLFVNEEQPGGFGRGVTRTSIDFNKSTLAVMFSQAKQAW